MNPAEYDRMYQLEDDYWWFVARRELVVGCVRDLPGGSDRVIVDIGCGTGANALALSQQGRVVGLDPSPLALQWSRRRNFGAMLQGSAESIPMADRSTDVVVATDVIEHLDDDLAALREFRRVLKPGGHAVITVPAFMFLWSEHDDALMHRRRYTAGLLRSRAEAAGFEVARLTYTTHLLFPLALTRLLKRSRPNPEGSEAQLKPLPGPINRLMLGIQRLEVGMLRHVSLPWGLGLAAVLKRPHAEVGAALRGPISRRITGRVDAAVRGAGVS